MAAPTVWIVNKGSHPYHHAEKYGEQKVLTEGRVNIFAVDNLTAQICARLRAEAGPNDYVLISGYNVPNTITAAWFLKKYGRVRWLMWGATKQEYSVLTLDNTVIAV